MSADTGTVMSHYSRSNHARSAYTSPHALRLRLPHQELSWRVNRHLEGTCLLPPPPPPSGDGLAGEPSSGGDLPAAPPQPRAGDAVHGGAGAGAADGAQADHG